MTLTHSQKKYLKKNLNKLSLEKIAANLGLKSQDILNFAKKNWSREKYQKLIKQNRSSVTRKKQRYALLLVRVALDVLSSKDSRASLMSSILLGLAK